MNLQKPYFVSSASKEAMQYKTKLKKQYGSFTADECDVVIALGGDGFMLEALLPILLVAAANLGQHALELSLRFPLPPVVDALDLVTARLSTRRISRSGRYRACRVSLMIGIQKR